MPRKPKKSGQIVVYATYAPDAKKLENMLDLKARCEQLGVSLPQEVKNFFLEFPQHEEGRPPCSHGQHTRILQNVTSELEKIGDEDFILVDIPRAELDSLHDLKFNRLLVFVPSKTEVESA